MKEGCLGSSPRWEKFLRGVLAALCNSSGFRGMRLGGLLAARAACGLRRIAVNQLHLDPAGDELLFAVRFKIDRGTFRVRLRDYSVTVLGMFQVLRLFECLHKTLLVVGYRTLRASCSRKQERMEFRSTSPALAGEVNAAFWLEG